MLVGKINGPASWYRFVHNGTVYDFLGDKHFSVEGTCEGGTEVNELVEYILKRNERLGITTDFYLESKFRHRDSSEIYNPRKDQDYISKLEEKLIECLSPDKNKCQYDKNIIRIHYADIRLVLHEKHLQTNLHLENYIEKLTGRLSDVMNRIAIDGEKIETEPYMKELEELKRTIYSVVNTFNSLLSAMEDSSADFRENIDNIIDKIPDNKSGTVLKKKMNNMKLLTSLRNGISVHRTSVQLYHNSHKSSNDIILFMRLISMEKQKALIVGAKKAINLANHLLINSEKITIMSIRAVQQYMHDISSLLIDLSALIMDEYLLARMFRFSDSKQVIVYAGYGHIERYAQFFEEILKVGPTLFSSYRGNRCIENYILHDFDNKNSDTQK